MARKAFKRNLLLTLMFFFSSVGEAVDSNEKDIVLKLGKVYKSISATEVKSMTITIFFDPVMGTPPLTKAFAGVKIGQLSKTLGLADPSEPGFPGAVVTGEVKLEFTDSGSAPRSLDILQGLLEDADYPEVIYQTTEIINYAWLEKASGP